MKTERICVIVLFMVMLTSFAHALEPVGGTQRNGSETITTGPDIEELVVGAQPTATVTLDPISDCTYGRLQIAITTPHSRTREYVRATTSTGVILREAEHSSGPGTSYTGSYNFPFSSSVPSGTIVTLYGYMGHTPPSTGNTAEFSISYRCDTLAVLQACAGPYSGQCAGFPALNGLWFKLNAVAQGYTVDNHFGGKVKKNITVPLYMGFAWDDVNSQYNVSIFTETAPGVWTNNHPTTRIPSSYTQNFFPDWGLSIYLNSTDHIHTYHTPYIKYTLDHTGAVKKATYSGIGEVNSGSFEADSLTYMGNVKISGSTVSVSTLPFTP